MSFPRSLHVFTIVFLVVFTLATASRASDGVEWRPVTPAELQMSKPVVDPEADAEAIFWEVTLDDKKRGKMTLYHYVRVKIFTERGREKFAKFDIPFSKRVKIDNIAARVIKPDGTIVDVQPGDIFERELVKAGKIKINAKSFAVPGIEPGVIVEYQYEEARKGDSVNGEKLLFQRDIPIQKISYFIRPYKGTTLETKPYNMTGDTRFAKDGEHKGFVVLTRTNVPALKDEPYMPPDDEVRRWMYLRYKNFGSIMQWSFISIGAGKWFYDITKPNKEIKKKAAELTAGASSDEEKLKRIYDFVQKNIRNLTFDTSLTEDQRDDIKLKDADDVLRQSAGTSSYIDLLFASLARAADFETNFVLSGDRSEQFFNPDRYEDSDFVHPCCIAVKSGNNWKYYDPGSPYLPFGTLVWYEESTGAMLIGENGFIWTSTPLTNAAQSRSDRKGRFHLSEDGVLEGTVRIEYNGQQAAIRRMNGWMKSASKRADDFEEDFKHDMSSAEISDLRFENFTDPTKPLVCEFKVRVPGYAQKTGKRMFVQPGVFEFGAKPVFTSAKREYDIYFPYPWSEEDDIEIVYPEGYTLENAESPGKVVDTNGVGGQEFNLSVDKGSRTLIYKRHFFFAEGSLYFKSRSYDQLKKMFDLFNSNDQEAITLRKADDQ